VSSYKVVASFHCADKGLAGLRTRSREALQA
jgi:hypothetical protein